MPYETTNLGYVVSGSNNSYEVRIPGESNLQDVSSVYPKDFYPPNCQVRVGFPAVGDPEIASRGTHCNKSIYFIPILYTGGGWTGNSWAQGITSDIAPQGEGEIYYEFEDHNEEPGLFDGTYLWSSKKLYTFNKDGITFQNNLPEHTYVYDPNSNISHNSSCIDGNKRKITTYHYIPYYSFWRFTTILSNGTESHFDFYESMQIFNVIANKNYCLVKYQFTETSPGVEESKKFVYDWNENIYESSPVVLDLTQQEGWYTHGLGFLSVGFSSEEDFFVVFGFGAARWMSPDDRWIQDFIYFAYNTDDYSDLDYPSDEMNYVYSASGAHGFGDPPVFDRRHLDNWTTWEETTAKIDNGDEPTEDKFESYGDSYIWNIESNYSNDTYRFVVDHTTEELESGILKYKIYDWKWNILYTKTISIPISGTGLTIQDSLLTDDSCIYMIYHNPSNMTLGVLGIDVMNEKVLYRWSCDVGSLPEKQEIFIYGSFIGVNTDKGWKIIR